MHPNEIAINDYVDESLAPAERADVDLHVASCAECRALVDDLRELRRAAGSLDVREVPVRAWTRIERAITFEAESARSTQIPQKGFVLRAPRALRSTSGLMWLAAAAVLLLATAVGLRVLPRTLRTDTPANPPGVAVSSDTAQSVEAELRQAEAHYEKAIKGLEQIANAEQGALDPQTAATLQKNLSVIDQAISESRAALRVEPSSEPAQQSLIDSFKTKMGLLQNTVALINEMRKGNEAGAARIVSGLKPKG
jgi:anti-sigma factor RsiW